MSGQHNARAMGHEGRNVRTPTLDWIAEDGVRFPRAYCNNPICGPSRLSYITGQYPHTHRHVGNDLHEFPQRNPNTIWAVARRHGYQTALIGKSHMIGEWDREGFEYIRYCDLTEADRMDPLTNHYFRYLVEQGIAEDYRQGRLPQDHPGRGTLKFESAMSYEHSLEAWTGRETRRPSTVSGVGASMRSARVGKRSTRMRRTWFPANAPPVSDDRRQFRASATTYLRARQVTGTRPANLTCSISSRAGGSAHEFRDRHHRHASLRPRRRAWQ